MVPMNAHRIPAHVVRAAEDTYVSMGGRVRPVSVAMDYAARMDTGRDHTPRTPINVADDVADILIGAVWDISGAPSAYQLHGFAQHIADGLPITFAVACERVACAALLAELNRAGA